MLSEALTWNLREVKCPRYLFPAHLSKTSQSSDIFAKFRKYPLLSSKDQMGIGTRDKVFPLWFRYGYARWNMTSTRKVIV